MDAEGGLEVIQQGSLQKDRSSSFQRRMKYEGKHKTDVRKAMRGKEFDAYAFDTVGDISTPRFWSDSMPGPGIWSFIARQAQSFSYGNAEQNIGL